MNETDNDGISQAFIEDFVKHQLPLIIRTRDEVEAGKRLSDGEIDVLAEQLARARNFSEVAFVAPEYQPLIAQAIATYEEITELALRNEKAATDQGTT